LLAKAFEEVDMFRFFACELQQRAHAIVISLKLRSGVIHQKWENELLDQTENREVGMPSDLVQRPLFGGTQKIEWLHSRQRLGHKRFREIKLLIAANDVFNTPVDLLRSGQRRLI